ncbi:hypothetical protein EJ05DRAFT_510806 [Pseudovirgaria hyperparasitica]|uniref:FAD-binding FR-type domain-containing protein n=1 Tax=Pseudovirgaria hyperparasitica TaxID=470096 RepID=A0A6A6W5R5_9PEZI|nr:uncharacterized protein EJ05DRAFT_510806 [Pseudovirgaria hyperparasitica]KAF2757943.1 hypothetical protein EJ05DRAFT_510806 [Pseudovirgaria hyperparasitica]
MAFGYEFVDLSDEQKHARRVALDTNGAYLQLSVLFVLLTIYASAWMTWLVERYTPRDDGPPKSPFQRANNQTQKGVFGHTRLLWKRVLWWSGGPLMRGWGTRGQWVCGSLWSLWMLYLCLRNTMPDYWHVTKRFGMIPTAVLPFQYLLAMRSSLSPIQYLTRLSHEELKATHLILGRIIIIFYVVHGSLYLNGFIQNGVLLKRLLDYDVVFGLAALLSFVAISTSALSFIRNWSYRTFYVIHVFLAVLLLEPMYFHCHHTHIFVWQTLVAIILLNILRLFKIRTYDGQISLVPGSRLVQVIIPLNTRNSLTWGVGEHVFLSQITDQTSKFALYDVLSQWFHVNPFTIASLPGEDDEVVLVARTLQGSTRLLADAAHRTARETQAEGSHSTTRLMVEGPYGGINHVPDLKTFDTILFIAGGVGATFTIPVYRTVMNRAISEPGFRGQIRFVWAVRTLSETRWAFPSTTADRKNEGNSFTAVPKLAEIYITGSRSTRNTDTTGRNFSGDVELEEGENLLPAEEDEESCVPPGVVLQHGRPNLNVIVDDVFSNQHGRVAIFACGPRTLTDSLRCAVGKWVYLDRNVFYKAEVFGY